MEAGSGAKPKLTTNRADRGGRVREAHALEAGVGIVGVDT